MGATSALSNSLGSKPMRDEAPGSTVRITFFGDSIFVGQGVSIYRGWVTKIAQHLDDFGREKNISFLVTNASVNGRTTRQALEDMPYGVQSSGVDILIVQFGLNDCNYWLSDRGLPRVSLGAYKENLREIVSRGQRFGAFRILLNNNHPTSRDIELLPNVGLTYEDSNRSYCKAVAELAEELGEQVSFQDVNRHFLQKISESGDSLDRYLLPDRLHLSVDGHEAYYEFMLPAVMNAVQDFLAAPSR